MGLKLIIRKLAVAFMAKKKIEKIWRIKKSNLILGNETEKAVNFIPKIRHFKVNNTIINY